MGKETHQGRQPDKAPPASSMERQRRRVSDQGAGDRQGGSGAGGLQKGEAHSRDREADKDEGKDDDSGRKKH
jgi:hypothetical protein